MTPTRGFTLSGVALPAEEDPLGLWGEGEEGLAFDVEARPAVTSDGDVRLSLAPEEALAALEARMQALALAQADLARAERELAALGGREAVSFDPSDELYAQKSLLMAEVEALQTPVAYGVSFSQDEEAQALYRQWCDFVQRVQEMVSHYVRVETALAGASIGLTTIDWTGDFDTTWAPDLEPNVMSVHLKAVQVKLATRVALMRIISVVATGGIGLAAKVTVPGAQLLLLPAIYRFVRDVLAELRRSWPQLQL